MYLEKLEVITDTLRILMFIRKGRKIGMELYIVQVNYMSSEVRPLQSFTI